MRVRVDFIAPSGPVKGRRDAEVSLDPGSTIEDLVQALCVTYGERAKEMLLESDGRTPYVRFIVNNKVVPFHYVIKETDRVSVLPPIGGG